MTADPKLVPRDALRGRRIAISVSESADLARLGLDPFHLRLAIAELTRAIVLAGGTVVFGGRIDIGFTRIIREEAEQYGSDQLVFEHYVPYSEHADIPPADLLTYAEMLGANSAVHLIDAQGAVAPAARADQPGFARAIVEPAAALTTARRLIAEACDGHVIVGGRLSGYAGAMPGVVEEAVLTIRKGTPLYVAGGFGGAAAFVGRHRAPELYRWLPEGMPQGADAVADDIVLDALRGTNGVLGLDAEEALRLASSNRPADIATLTVLGLSRLASS